MKIIFSGSAEFALPALKSLLAVAQLQLVGVYTHPDRQAGRGLKVTTSVIKDYALMHNLPIFQPHSLKDPLAQEQLRSLQADVFIDVAYGMLLPKAVLGMFRFGCINIHPSLLPRWRGAAPIPHALMAGDKVTGVTIMQIDAGLDTGPILRQQELPITNEDTAASLLEKTAILGADLLMSVLPGIAAGTCKAVPQNDSLATYAPKLSKEEATLDWNLSAHELERKIRAYNPWPIAHSKIGEVELRVWQAIVLSATSKVGSEVGAIIAATPEGIDVTTGTGILRLLRLQIAGKKVLGVRELLQGYKTIFVPGARFGHTAG